MNPNRKKTGSIILSIALLTLLQIIVLYLIRPNLAGGQQNAFGGSLVWKIMILSALNFIPNLMMGYHEIKYFWGFIPPALLNFTMWSISMLNIRRLENGTTEFLPAVHLYISMTVLMAGVFGMVLTAFSSRVFRRRKEKAENRKISEKIDAKDENTAPGNIPTPTESGGGPENEISG